MTKAELIEQVQHLMGDDRSKKRIAEGIQVTMNIIIEELLTNGRFSYPGVGIWKVKQRVARTGRNPRTGATLDIPASMNISFKPAQALKNSL
jgi:DNA-binding protein HU-beta